MPSLRWMGKLGAGLVVLLAAVAVADEPEQGNPPVQTLKAKRIVVTKAKDDATPQTIVVEGDDDAGGLTMSVVQVPKSEYWIGAACGPIPDALRAHVSVPKDQGVLVLDVVPDGPAAKAGIQQHDIVLSVNAAAVSDLPALVKAIDEAKGNEIAVEILREGKPKTLQMTPAKRPEEAAVEPERTGLDQAEWKRLNELLERLQPGPGGRQPLRLRFFHPGTILPPGAPAQPALPGNLSISITKQGGEPARVVVKRGDDTWETTEKDIDKLPADIQPHVRRMLEGVNAGPGVLAPQFDFVPDWAPASPGGAPEVQERLQRRVQEQLDRMDQRMKELQERVERLRDRDTPPPPAPPEPPQPGPDAEK